MLKELQNLFVVVTVAVAGSFVEDIEIVAIEGTSVDDIVGVEGSTFC